MTNVAELAGWLALAYASGFSLARTKAIVGRWCLEARQPLTALFGLTAAELATALNLSAAECAAVRGLRDQLNRHASWCQQLGATGVQVITRADPAYPAALTCILTPAEQPLLLFVRGELPPPEAALAAIASDPRADALVTEMALDLATLLGDARVVLTSGLSECSGGIAVDSAVANTRGRALLVAPMGIGALEVDATLAQAIEQGQVAIVSPFRPDTPTSDVNERASHQLIAALADAVIVMQAAAGGAMHEMSMTALRLGRPVYVWDADPDDGTLTQSQQMLIEAGGLPVREMADVLDIVASLTALADGRCASTVPKQVGDQPAVGAAADVGAMHPDDVLAVLVRSGHIPEVLRRRLQRC